MAANHGVLHRMQAAVGVFEAFHGFDGFAIERGQQLNAAVDRHIVHARASGIELADHDHAGAAIALGTALFGAGAAQLFAQIIENRGGAAHTLRLDNLAVQHKAHGVGDLGHVE